MGWSKSFKLPDHHASYGIGLASLPDDRLVCVHRDARNTSLWWTIADKKGWSKDYQFPKHYSANGASLALFNGVLHCVHRGGSDDDWIYYAVYDPAANKWSNDAKVPGARSSRNPAIAEYTDNAGKKWLMCVSRGWDQDERLWFTKYDGHGWTTFQLISEDGHHCWGDPAMCLYKGILHCVHRGKYTDDNLYYTTFNGTWSPDYKLPDHRSGGDHHDRGSVGVTADDKELYCLHRGAVLDQHIWWTHFNGQTWSTDEKLPNKTHALGLAKSGKTLFCVHIGDGDDDNLYYMENAIGAAAAV